MPPLSDTSKPLASSSAERDRAVLPAGATDAHVHVFEPARFPYCSERTYTPGAASLQALQNLHAQLGIERLVLVQPSVYGTDNSCMLATLAQAGPGGCRGIAVVDLERVTRSELDGLHKAGVRGIRLNVEVRHHADPKQLRGTLARAAALVDLPGWCIQLHCAASLLESVAQCAEQVRVPIVLDHFAGLRAEHGGDQSKGPLGTLLRLLASDRVYVKLSAPYRVSCNKPPHADLTALATTLIEARPDRMLWGSDWPHTGSSRDRCGDLSRIEPFRNIDLAATLDALRLWASDEPTLQRILVDNPARLYGFAPRTAS